MGRNIPLGRLAGIKVSMSPLVLLTAGLYAYLFADNRLPILHPGHSTTAYWVAGISGALLFFVSLMVHELGHALVARDEGIGVRSMELTLLGGVTRMESSPETAGAELRVSIVGPIASAACGITLIAAGYVLPNDGLWALAGDLASWVGILNIALAVFNILPAAPLDGGKVLSALVWMRTGNQVLAMRIAASAGLVVGLGSVYLGLRDFGGDNNVWALSLLLVGGFIAMNAVRELQSAPMVGALSGITVSMVMTADAPVAPQELTVADFLRASRPRADHQAFLVVDAARKVIGVLTGSAIRAVPEHSWGTITVGALAFPLERLVRVSPGEALLPALQKIDGAEVRTGLVVEPSGAVIGTIDPSAVHRAMQQRRAGLVPAS